MVRLQNVFILKESKLSPEEANRRFPGSYDNFQESLPKNAKDPNEWELEEAAPGLLRAYHPRQRQMFWGVDGKEWFIDLPINQKVTTTETDPGTIDNIIEDVEACGAYFVQANKRAAVMELLVGFGSAEAEKKWIKKFRSAETAPLTNIGEKDAQDWGREEWDLGVKLEELTNALNKTDPAGKWKPLPSNHAVFDAKDNEVVISQRDDFVDENVVKRVLGKEGWRIIDYQQHGEFLLVDKWALDVWYKKRNP